MQTSSRNNRFNLLRLVAALAVFVAHGVFLYRLHLPVPFVGHSLGSLAVYVFFNRLIYKPALLLCMAPAMTCKPCSTSG